MSFPAKMPPKTRHFLHISLDLQGETLYNSSIFVNNYELEDQFL